jgi:cation diffusion facilitator family transporter
MDSLHSKANAAIRITLTSLAINIAITIVKWIAGIWGHSFALIADAIESTNDIFSSICVLIGLKFSQKAPDQDHPYGHGKAEALVTFLVVGFLVASATLIIYESISNIRHPHPSPAPFTLIVLGAIILIKEVFYRIMMRYSAITGSGALKADAWHHRSDAVTSLVAFGGILLALLLGPQYSAADDWAALVAAGFILYNSYLILRPALGEIMDEQTYDELIVHIRRIAQTVDGVIDTEKCYVRKAGMMYFVDLHAHVSATISVIEGHAIAHRLKDAIRVQIPEVHDVLIHIEPYIMMDS